MNLNNIQTHCNLCCDNCNELKASYRTPCGGFIIQCINPIKGYTIYKTKCLCSPYFGQNEMIYLKYMTPYSEYQKACNCNLQRKNQNFSWICFPFNFLRNCFKFR